MMEILDGFLCLWNYANIDTFIGSDTINDTTMVMTKQHIYSIGLEYVSFDAENVNGGIMMM